MKKSRILSAVLSTAMLASCFTGFSASAAPAETAVGNEYAVLSEAKTFDFTSMSAVPAYSAETGSGFVSTTTSVASYTVTDDSDATEGTGRTVAAVESITLDGGAKVTESDGSYIDAENYGGLVFKVDVEPGMYNVTVVGIDGTAKDNTSVAISGMQASRLTSGGAWDSAGLVNKTGVASWTDNAWSYDYVSGEGFIEVEVEPALKPSADAPKTVGVKSITITPIALEEAGAKPTVFVLGDSTQKTYTWEENGMSGYGQVLYKMFDLDKVNVINYSMGGRSMKANYQEGRFNDVLAASKPGDYVFIHSAHNDESTGATAGPQARFGRGSNEATYKNWLYKVYIPSMKAMGVTPVLVSSMPRLTGSGAPRDYFTPNSPVILKEAAANTEGVLFVDLFSGAIDYLNAIGTEEAKHIYMSIEAGETAGKTNSGSYANGHPDNKIDGTHYKEAAAKQWARIIAEDIYAQKGALSDLLSDDVKKACEDGNWTEHVFPEMANDVSTIGNTSADATSQGNNAYYRNQIEKVLQLGVMSKDSEGNFYPDKDMTVGGFAKALTELWGLDESVLSEYMDDEDVTVTDAPATDAPTDVPATDAPVVTVDAVKIVATYDADGRLVSVKSEDIKYDGTVDAVDGAKVFVWDDLNSMKPAVVEKAAVSEVASLSDDLGGDYLAVSEKYTEGDTITAGDVMMDTSNVTVVACGDASTVKVGGGSFASNLCFQLRLDKDYSGDPATVAGKAGSIGLLVTPKVDGRLYIEAKVGTGKTMKVTDGSNTMGEFANDTGASQFPTIEADLKAGTTYCVFERGGTGEVYGIRFIDAASIPTPAPTATPDPNATPEPELVDYTPISGKAALTREAMAAIIYDAYEAKFGKASDGTWNKPKYMTDYNGTTVTPDSPEYDPNLTGSAAQYYPLVGWGVITDKEAIAAPLYAKVKEVYNLGLMRSEAGIARGSMKNGTEMEPTVIVTRAKAAKELYFLYNLIQPVKGENQVIPGENMAFTKTESLVEPDYTLPRYPGGDEVEPTPVPTATPTPEPTLAPGELPADVLWRADDSAFDNAIAVKEATTVNGLTVYPNFTEKARTAEYTHIDGTAYTFTRGWCGGTGNETNRSLSFVPKQACTVTVVFDGNGSAGRTMNIAQAGSIVESKNSEAGVTVLTADIEDPSKGAVSVYGGGSNKNIFAIFVEYYDPNQIVYRNLSGNVNYTGSIDMTGKNLVFTNVETGEATKVAYGSTYSVDLVQRSTYAITVEGYEEQICATLDTKEVYIAKADKTFDIDLLEIKDTEVTGEIVSHGLDMTGVTVTFTAQDDPTITETATISAVGADKEMPEAEYALSVVLTPNHVYDVTTSDVTGWTMSDLSKTYTMAAGDTTPFKNLLFTKDVVAEEWRDTVTVGADKEFKTITDAVNAIKAMTNRPSGEAGRTAIVVDPGTYCEQVTVNVANVTLKAADEANRPVLTWYYGIGYVYYSANNGYYSEQHYVERTAKSTATRWGCTLRVAATGFLAENIIFENSFNCRVVADELADGVWPEVDPADGGKPDRTVEGFDAKAKTSTERAAAFAGDATNYECYRCEFISSQDTLYTGYNGYFKECYIEGGTDFIFGGNSILFEDCTLAWHGYSDVLAGGYLTACQTSSVPTAGTPNLANNGYLFKDCTVTNSKYYTDNQFAAGGWGRNWGGAKCQVVFLNTTLDGVDVPGAWVKMGGELADSILYVDGVTDKDGNAVDTSGTTFNPNGTMATNGYTVMVDEDYFGAWIPKHYEGEIVLTEYTSIFQFGLGNGAPELNLQGAEADLAAAETNDPDGMSIHINATSGKVYNVGRTDEWAQCNAGTVITIPVVNGTKITAKTYQNMGHTIGGLDMTGDKTYTYVGAEGTVDLVATGNSYISNITVITPTSPEPYDPTTYKVNVTEGYENGTVEVSATEAAQSQVVAITATPADGYVIDEFEVETASGVAVEVSKDNTFVMPAEDVTITITFELYVQPDQGDTINYVMNWSGNNGEAGGVTMDSTTQDWLLFDRYVTVKNMQYSNSHGAQGTGPIEVQVPGSVDIVVGTCAYDDVKVVVTDAAGNVVGVSDDVVGTAQGMTSGGNGTYNCYGSDNGSVDFTYEGEATTLTISFEPSTNGAQSNARFWLPYLSVVSVAGSDTGSDTETTPEPEEAEPVDLVADFSGEGLLTAEEVATGTKVDFGINAAGERVAADSADAVMVVDATTHASVHGLIWFKSTVKVSGPAMITAGTCAWGADLIVKDADGNEVAKVNTNNGTCFHGDKTNNVVTTYYKGEGTTLSISGGNYLPYIAVKEIDASEIPSEATLTFELGDVAAEGTVPTAQTVEIGAEAVIPVNRTLYVEGSTLTGWTDGTNTYVAGEAVTVTENITLTPVFEANTAKLGDAETTVAYDFQQKNGTPVVAIQGKTAFLVYQATIGEAVIDVKMDVDTTSGKLANGSWQDWAQVNVGTKFIVPALAGSTVTVDTIYNDGNYTINGTAYTQTGQSAGETVTIADATTIEIVAGDPTGSYWRGFTVTYPAIAE